MKSTAVNRLSGGSVPPNYTPTIPEGYFYVKNFMIEFYDRNKKIEIKKLDRILNVMFNNFINEEANLFSSSY